MHALPSVQVLGNKVGSAYHAELLRESLPEGMGWFGALPNKRDGCLPERHLGLLQVGEWVERRAGSARIAESTPSHFTCGRDRVRPYPCVQH